MNTAEPQFDIPGRTPNVPDHLDTTAAEVWRELGPQLLRAGLLTSMDKTAFGMLAAVVGRWIDAERELAKHGPVLISKSSGNFYQNPWLHVCNKAWDQVRAMFAEFGLTPSSRQRLTVAIQEEPDTLTEILTRRLVDEK